MFLPTGACESDTDGVDSRGLARTEEVAFCPFVLIEYHNYDNPAACIIFIMRLNLIDLDWSWTLDSSHHGTLDYHHFLLLQLVQVILYSHTH